MCLSLSLSLCVPLMLSYGLCCIQASQASLCLSLSYIIYHMHHICLVSKRGGLLSSSRTPNQGAVSTPSKHETPPFSEPLHPSLGPARGAAEFQGQAARAGRGGEEASGAKSVQRICPKAVNGIIFLNERKASTDTELCRRDLDFEFLEETQ